MKRTKIGYGMLNYMLLGMRKCVSAFCPDHSFCTMSESRCFVFCCLVVMMVSNGFVACSLRKLGKNKFVLFTATAV